MGTNKVATVVLFDVSQMMAAATDNGETFFERSLKCFKRMILRKIFSLDNDDLGVVLFGSEETNNGLSKPGTHTYRNIYELSPLSLVDWDLYEKVDNLRMSSLTKTDWVQAMVAAQDFMLNQTRGRKYRNKQLVVFSNLNSEISVYVEAVDPIVKALEAEKIKLIVIGNNLEGDCEGKELDSELVGSLRLMFRCITNLKDAVQFSFSEIENDLKYYENKRKMVRFYSTFMHIGSRIQLPIRWMKLNKDKTRFKWETPPEIYTNTTANCSTFVHSQDKDEPKIEFETDTVKRTNFGGTMVDLSYADLEALKRTTGPPCMTYLGSVKIGRISRSMFVGKEQYVIVADKSARSVTMFSAFVDALIKAKKCALARRIASKNGKVVVGALLPVSDEFGKAMYFLKLPFKEYLQYVPMIQLPHSKNEEAKEAVNKLIDNMMLPDDLVEEDKGILLRDPTFQSRCHALYLRAVGQLPEQSLIPLPETVQQILKPHPFNDEAESALDKIATFFPFISDEDKLSGSAKKQIKKETPGISDYKSIVIPKEYIVNHPAKQYAENVEDKLAAPVLTNTAYEDNDSEDLFE